MNSYLFFDNASTTKCCSEAVEQIQKFATEEFGNPSSAHALGQKASDAIREARAFFAESFGVEPKQVVFTGSGTESDNLAIYGVGMEALVHGKSSGKSPRVLTSVIEHPAVRKTVESLASLGIDTQFVPVQRDGQIDREKFLELLTPETVLVSLQHVNNIVGAVQDIEGLARHAKERVPHLVFHTDAVQAFGKVQHPRATSAVDLVSISGHKVHGPKGVGALIILNPDLLKAKIRPLIWGGEQESGLRSGTQSPGLISAFHAAAKKTLAAREENYQKVSSLRDLLKGQLTSRGLLSPGKLVWNSPENAVPHIVSLGVPYIPATVLARSLEERDCLVSTGSACSSGKEMADPTLKALGVQPPLCRSTVRVSFSKNNTPEEVERLVDALQDSFQSLERNFSNTL